VLLPENTKDGVINDKSNVSVMVEPSSTASTTGNRVSWVTTTTPAVAPTTAAAPAPAPAPFPSRPFPDDAKFVIAPVNGENVRQIAPTPEVTEAIRNRIGLASSQNITWTAAHQIASPPSVLPPQLEVGATAFNSYVQEFHRLPNQTVWLYSNFSGGAIPNVPGFDPSLQRCEKMTPTYNPEMVPTFVAPATVIRS